MAADGRSSVIVRDGSWGFFFLLAYIGAAVYFISTSDGSFWAFILSLLQAIVWPAYVTYEVLLLLVGP